MNRLTQQDLYELYAQLHPEMNTMTIMETAQKDWSTPEGRQELLELTLQHINTLRQDLADRCQKAIVIPPDASAQEIINVGAAYLGQSNNIAFKVELCERLLGQLIESLTPKEE